jgi:hypothetical protein
MMVENSLSVKSRTAVTDVNTDKTEHLLEERRVSLRELSGSLNAFWKGFIILLNWHYT